jgi:hypothetical protein
MRATIDFPEPIFEALQSRSAEQGSNVQAVILQVIENALGTSPNTGNNGWRVQTSACSLETSGRLTLDDRRRN